MKKLLYMHSGSGNHGCEAIIRTTSAMLQGPKDLYLWSFAKNEDEMYGAADCYEGIIETEQIERFSMAHLEALIRRRVFRQADANLQVFLRESFRNSVAFSIGGDNYCYPWSARKAVEWNEQIRKTCRRSVLWGCSVDENAITDQIAQDLAGYDLITAREGITYGLLKRINPHTVQVADPAFLLERVEKELPKEFDEKNTVGVNVSPLIMKYTPQAQLLFENYIRLIQYILDEKKMNVCLIPHVVQNGNDDREPLRKLYERFRGTGRVCMVDDCPATELKGYIARCRFFVGARTHATIAAYSSGVPTLVVGYSVKSRGIAQDLFETEKQYVLSAQNVKSENELKDSFAWLVDHEKQVKDRLNRVLPGYIQRAGEAIRYLDC